MTVTPILSAWGDAVAARRRELGLRQADVAEKAGCLQSTVSMIEAGSFEPSLRIRLAVAAALDVAHDELFGVRED